MLLSNMADFMYLQLILFRITDRIFSRCVLVSAFYLPTTDWNSTMTCLYVMSLVWPTGLEDLIDVSTYLLTLNPDQVFGLGLALGLLVTTLNPIKSSPTFLDDVLTAWLLGKDTVRRRGGHTWQALVNGLRHGRVNQTEIASRVERERCQQS